MADVKFSGVGVVDMNGSIGNMTFSRNFYGTYAKTRILTVGSNSFLVDWQTEVASLSNIWQFGLSDSDRLLWLDVQRLFKDDLAMQHTRTGFALFMSVNLNLFLANFSQINIPPARFKCPPYSPIQLDTSTPGTLIITFSPITLATGALYFSFPLPPGRMSNNQIYGFTSRASSIVGSFDFSATYLFRFGSFPPGKKVFARFVPIDDICGQRGVASYASAIIS